MLLPSTVVAMLLASVAALVIGGCGLIAVGFYGSLVNPGDGRRASMPLWWGATTLLLGTALALLVKPILY